MSSVPAIRAAIVAMLVSVPDIGVVHAYERYANDLPGLRQYYWSAPHNQVRGWYVRRPATSEQGNVFERSVEIVRWRIVGVMSLSDAAASELAFDALIESVRDAVRADETLGGVVDQCSLPGGTEEAGIQLDDAGPAMFGGMLCHVARLGLNTVRYLGPPA
ncbi:MAG TPA: hypothetical protein PKZ76_03325 [Xanthomonadaceae bacterium]|nr:hypothetical protein [Xanthomonadaceae bacterium]